LTPGEGELLYTVFFNGPEDSKGLPKDVSVSGPNYLLGMINMWDKIPGHYTSLHYVDKKLSNMKA
jgi:hypothetical protein